MGQYLSITVIILTWLISFVGPSGWAGAHHLPEKINFLIILISTGLFLSNPKNKMYITNTLFFGLALTSVIIPYILSGKWDGATYSISFLVVYIISCCKITAQVIRYSCYAIAGLGIFVLLIYTRGSLLSGWNDNAMAMVGLFSYLYFAIFLISKKGCTSFWIWNIVTIIYLLMLFKTDCRSGMLFSLITVLCIIFSNKSKYFLKKKNILIIILNLPVLISFLVIAISATPHFKELNTWSINNFGKQIFSEREILWEYAYDMLINNAYLGSGKFMFNYHNSGVAALSVFGVFGYLLWIKFFYYNLTTLKYYISDGIVFGSMLSFVIIFLQQALDLGFIEKNPNLLPYLILGVGLGRIRYLRNHISTCKK